MSDIHITRELLRAVFRAELPPRVLAEIGYKHLLALCPTCREEMLAWQEEKGAPPQSPPLHLLPTLLKHHGLEEKQMAAEKDFQDLMRIPREARRSKIRRAHRRFRGTLLARRLLDESRKRMTMDPAAADELAETAEAVLLHTPGSPGLADLRALVAVYRGNVSRLHGRPDEAKAFFRQARATIRNAGVTDPLLFAETDSCEAVLSLEQRRFGEAEELLNRSVALYILGNARNRAAQPLISLSNLYYYQGDSLRARELAEAETADGVNNTGPTGRENQPRAEAEGRCPGSEETSNPAARRVARPTPHHGTIPLQNLRSSHFFDKTARTHPAR